MLISILKMPVDSTLRRIERLVIAIVDDRWRHSAEYRLDDVEELGPGGQRSGLYNRIPTGCWFFIPLFDFSEELLGDVPRVCISGQIDGLAVAILGAQQIHHLDHLLGVLLV